MITLRDLVDGEKSLAIAAYGTSQGAVEGWDTRGRGREDSPEYEVGDRVKAPGGRVGNVTDRYYMKDAGENHYQLDWGGPWVREQFLERA